jgi:hypothetical protein
MDADSVDSLQNIFLGGLFILTTTVVIFFFSWNVVGHLFVVVVKDRKS